MEAGTGGVARQAPARFSFPTSATSAWERTLQSSDSAAAARSCGGRGAFWTAVIAALEDAVASYDPNDLRVEIAELGALISQARVLERKEIEVKIRRLRELMPGRGVFQDPAMKLLIFTEHKDTLDFLAGDGKEGRPLGKLREWGLSLTQIHGSMKIGDRETPGSRKATHTQQSVTSQAVTPILMEPNGGHVMIIEAITP